MPLAPVSTIRSPGGTDGSSAPQGFPESSGDAPGRLAPAALVEKRDEGSEEHRTYTRAVTDRDAPLGTEDRCDACGADPPGGRFALSGPLLPTATRSGRPFGFEAPRPEPQLRRRRERSELPMVSASHTPENGDHRGRHQGQSTADRHGHDLPR